jgi:hypothetical protein
MPKSRIGAGRTGSNKVKEVKRVEEEGLPRQPVRLFDPFLPEWAKTGLTRWGNPASIQTGLYCQGFFRVCSTQVGPVHRT